MRPTSCLAEAFEVQSSLAGLYHSCTKNLGFYIRFPIPCSFGGEYKLEP